MIAVVELVNTKEWVQVVLRQALGILPCQRGIGIFIVTPPQPQYKPPTSPRTDTA